MATPNLYLLGYSIEIKNIFDDNTIVKGTTTSDTNPFNSKAFDNSRLDVAGLCPSVLAPLCPVILH